ncbi:MAG: DNA alkylation repair protein [Tannerella sp.]|jgi:3-methyladenine DNA glycosylase AlkD|nr:DNA alkylation repair protein [Tannerella sp.]
MSKFEEIEKQFELNRNADNACTMAQYMRNQFKFYGLVTPARKKIYKGFLKTEKSEKNIDWAFLDRCYQSDYREFQYLVMDYLAAMQKYLKYDDIPKIKNFAKAKQWWDTIDGLDKIIGNIGLTDNRVDDLMIKWSEDNDFWIRRISIDHQLPRKDKTNTDLLSKIIRNNFGSNEFFINKAIGWSLREYSKYNPQWVKDFVEQNKNSMAKLSIREATKYL